MTIEGESAEVHALGVAVMVIVSCHRPKGKDTEIFNSTAQSASIFRYGQDFFPITIRHFLVILRREKLLINTKTQRKGQNQMCTVSIDIDEVAIRDLRPELDSTAAVRLWVQDLINLYIRQLKIEDEETMDIETAREMTLKAVREEYALP